MGQNTGLDYRKCLEMMNKQDFSADYSLRVVQFMQGKLKYAYKSYSLSAVQSLSQTALNEGRSHNSSHAYEH